jgi:hypothetical protein
VVKRPAQFLDVDGVRVEDKVDDVGDEGGVVARASETLLEPLHALRAGHSTHDVLPGVVGLYVRTHNSQ